MTEPMTTLEALRGVRKLLAEPERWTHTLMARDKWGRWTDVSSDAAVAWCLQGAINRVAPKDVYLSTRLQVPGGWTMDLAHFNDDPATTHADVLALLDRAIATEEETT